MVASLLEQDVVLGLLAAVGNAGSGGRQFDLGAIDEPRAGGVHALKTGEIEDHAFRVFSRGEERSPGRLELVSGADDPFPRQRQHDPVLAVLTSYGRRCGHQALRPSPNGAHIAPPRRLSSEMRPRHIHPRKDQGEQQIKYESETRSHGTRIRKQSESNLLRRAACRRLQGRQVGCRNFPIRRSAAPIRDAGERRGHKSSRNRRRRHRAIRRAKGNPFRAGPPSAVRHGCQSLAAPGGALPRSGTRAKETGTKGAGISDAAHRAIRRAKGNPNSPSPGAAAKSWRPMR